MLLVFLYNKDFKALLFLMKFAVLLRNTICKMSTIPLATMLLHQWLKNT